MRGKLLLVLRLLYLIPITALGILLVVSIGIQEHITRNDPTIIRQRVTQRFLARLSQALPFRVRIHGQLPKQPALWLANHISWTDIPLLGALHPLTFLSKAEVRHWPVAGWLAHKAGTLFIHRGAGETRQLHQQLCQHLEHGHSLLIFPEGTTTDGSTVRPFYGRLLSSAIDTCTAIQPVSIRYIRDGQPCSIAPFIGDESMFSHLLRLLANPISEVEITLLPLIDSNQGKRSELARLARSAIAETLHNPSTHSESREPEAARQPTAENMN